MRAEHVDLDVSPHHIHSRCQAHQFQHRLNQRAVAKQRGLVELLSHLACRLGQRHQARARALVQGFEQRLDFVFEHARHQPFAALVIDLIQHKNRHSHRQAVFGVAWFMQVIGGAIHAP